MTSRERCSLEASQPQKNSSVYDCFTFQPGRWKEHHKAHTSVKAAKSIIYKLESPVQILSSYNSEFYSIVLISAGYRSDPRHLPDTTIVVGTEADTLLILCKFKAAGPPWGDATLQQSVQQLKWGGHLKESSACFTGPSLPASISRSFNPQSKDGTTGSKQSTCCGPLSSALVLEGVARLGPPLTLATQKRN